MRMSTQEMSYKTLEEVCKDAVSDYDKWLKEHITMIDRLTGETLVAVNGYTSKAIKTLIRPVELGDSYAWRSAREVYFEEVGL